MRAIMLLVCLGACYDPDAATAPEIRVDFPDRVGTTVVPYRAGGAFSVRIIGNKSELGAPARASVEIVTPMVPTDAVVTSVATLTDQGNDIVAGTAILKWPPGGQPDLRVRAALGDIEKIEDVPLETVSLELTPTDLVPTGAQLVQPICIQSTASDGAITLHLDGARLENGSADATVPLVPGDCATNTVDVDNPSGVARVAPSVTDANVQIVVAQPPTHAIATFQKMAQPPGALELALDPPTTTTPPRLSIVTLRVLALVGGAPAKGVIVTFQTVPTTPIVPTAVVTDTDGRAEARFQVPKEGSLAVLAVSGSTTSSPIVFFP